MYRTGAGDFGIELDFAKRGFVIRHVLVEDRRQRLGLLRTQVNALEVSHFNLIFGLLLHGAEHQKEVPDVDPDLYAVGVGFAIVGSVDDGEIRLCGNDHTADSLSGTGAEGKRSRSFEALFQMLH